MPEPLKLTFKQSKLFKLLDDDNNTRILVDGSARSSKTTAIMCYLFSMMARYPGIKILCIRQFRAHIKISLFDNTAKALLKDRDDFTFEEGSLEITHKNGSSLRMDGLDGERAQKVLGTSYAIIFINEAVQTSYKSYKLAISRLDQQLEGLNARKLIMDCNPSSQFSWIYRYCIEGVDPESENPSTETWQRMHFTVQDNPHLPADTINSLKNLTGVEYKRLYLGQWVSVDNLVYPQFVIETHIFDRKLEDAEGYIMGVDCGTNDPMVLALFGIYSENDVKKLHLLDLHYEPGKDMSVSIGDVAEKWKHLNPYIFVDPSASPAILELKARGFSVEPANNRMAIGTTTLRDLLATNRIGFNRGFADKVIEEISQYEMNLKTELPINGTPDHLLDATRYATMGFTEGLINDISQICTF